MSVTEKNSKIEMSGKNRAVILGLSGGGDSVYLLHELVERRKTTDFYILAVHVHHGLRGEAADRDEEFSESLCEELGVDFLSGHMDVKGYAAEQGLTIEQAGREARYGLFKREARRLLEENADLLGVDIYLAHHANDQEETVLMNFLRGSGPAGLSGMRSCVDYDNVNGRLIRLIRPLLDITHEEIIDSLRARDLSWCEDATNYEPDFTRNKLRCNILPQLKEISPGLTKVCGREARLFAEIDDFLNEEAAKVFDKCAHKDGGALLFPVEELLGVHPALRHVIVRKCIDRVSGLKDISSEHVEAVEALLYAQSGREAQLPGNVKVCREFDHLSFMKKEDGDSGETAQTMTLDWEIMEVNGAGFDKNLEKYRSETYTKWFDYDKIRKYCGEGAPHLRYPQEKDFLLINSEGQKKRLAIYLKQAKIPQRKREKTLVVALGDVILWVPGLRDSAYFFVSKDTNRVLRLELKMS